WRPDEWLAVPPEPPAPGFRGQSSTRSAMSHRPVSQRFSPAPRRGPRIVAAMRDETDISHPAVRAFLCRGDTTRRICTNRAASAYVPRNRVNDSYPSTSPAMATTHLNKRYLHVHRDP